MAIIYTYPPLTNPQGNELIVVSDVNNKNATRLITIADIASLVPGGGGGGCDRAIVGFVDQAGQDLFQSTLCNDVEFSSASGNIVFAATANGIDFGLANLPYCNTSIGKIILPNEDVVSTTECKDEINFTSTGGTISITTTGDKDINFEVISAGGGGCENVFNAISTDDDTLTAVGCLNTVAFTTNASENVYTELAGSSVRIRLGLAENGVTGGVQLFNDIPILTTPSIASSGDDLAVQLNTQGEAFVKVPQTSSGVTQLVAGNNITITPSAGTGVVTVEAQGSGIGNSAGIAPISIAESTSEIINAQGDSNLLAYFYKAVVTADFQAQTISMFHMGSTQDISIAVYGTPSGIVSPIKLFDAKALGLTGDGIKDVSVGTPSQPNYDQLAVGDKVWIGIYSNNGGNNSQIASIEKLSGNYNTEQAYIVTLAQLAWPNDLPLAGAEATNKKACIEIY